MHSFSRYFEQTRRIVYVTPASFIELMKTTKNLMNKKRNEIQESKQRYANGVEKLEFSEQQISVMQVELQDLQPKLEQTSVETAVLIQSVSEVAPSSCYN